MKKLLIGALLVLLLFIQLGNDFIRRGNISSPEYEDDVGHLDENAGDKSICTFDIKYSSKNEYAEVAQVIKWFNRTGYPAEEIYLSLPLNSSEHSGNVNENFIETSNDLKTGYTFNKFSVDGGKVRPEYVTGEKFPGDSSLVRIPLSAALLPGDSVVLELDYSFDIPGNAKDFGYSAGNNFCLLADWHPYIVKFYKGVWRLNNYKPEPELFRFKGSFSIDTNFTAASSASFTSIDKSVYNFEQETSKELSFAVYKEPVIEKLEIQIPDGSKLPVDIFMLEENEDYLDRIKAVLNNSIHYLNDKIGRFPFDKLTLVNVPNNRNFGFKSYSSLITFYCDLFSPESLLEPEYDLARMIAEQYFNNNVTVLSRSDKWVKEGIPAYLAAKVMNAYYERPIIHFKFAGYVPVYGLNLLSYNEIPIIYTLREFDYNPAFKFVSKYYKNLRANAITDSSSLYDSEERNSAVSVKSSLILYSFDSSAGEQKVLNAVKELYKSETPENLTGNFTAMFSNQESSFLEDAFNKSFVYDYQVGDIIRKGKESYTVKAVRNGSGICPVRVYLYSDEDTVSTEWDGRSRVAGIDFSIKGEVYAAEIMPGYASLLDINNANNSYTIDDQYWGSLSIALRAFFWFQNALMIFGSVG